MNDYLADEELFRGLNFENYTKFELVDNINGQMQRELETLNIHFMGLKKKDRRDYKLYMLD